MFPICWTCRIAGIQTELLSNLTWEKGMACRRTGGAATPHCRPGSENQKLFWKIPPRGLNRNWVSFSRKKVSFRIRVSNVTFVCLNLVTYSLVCYY